MNTVQIQAFVNSLSNKEIGDLFHNYYCGAYDHLMEFPIIVLSPAHERKAIATYLDMFINTKRKEDIEDERKEELKRIVETYDYNHLKEILSDDQFFEEPLYHISNKMII